MNIDNMHLGNNTRSSINNIPIISSTITSLNNNGNNLHTPALPAIRVPPSTCRSKSGFSFFQNSPVSPRDNNNTSSTSILKRHVTPTHNNNNSHNNNNNNNKTPRDNHNTNKINYHGNSNNSSSSSSSSNNSNNNASRPRKILNLSLNIHDINQDVENGMMSPAGEQSRRDQRAIQIQCSSILDDFLYVGGVKVASNLDTLLQNNITHIINCVGQKCENLWPNHFKYLRYEIPDNGTDDICIYLRSAFEFIEQAKSRNGKILIHCVKGISRSPAIAIGYLMWKRRLTVEDALIIVRGHRQIADPNPSFVFQLKDWCERLHWKI